MNRLASGSNSTKYNAVVWKFPALQSAIEQLLIDVRTKFYANLSDHVDVRSSPRWRYDRQGLLISGFYEVNWNIRSLAEARTNPLFARVERTIAEDPDLITQFGASITTSFGTMKLDAWRVIQVILGEPVLSDDLCSISLEDMSATRERYRKLEELLALDTVDSVTVLVVSGLATKRSLKLSDGVTFRPLTKPEILHTLNSQMVRSLFPGAVPEKGRHGIVLEMQRPKLALLEKDWQLEHEKFARIMLDTADDVKAATAILNDTSLRIHGALYRGNPFLGGGSSPYLDAPSPWDVGPPEPLLASRQAKELIQIWQALHSMREGSGSALRIACHRYGYSRARPKLDDKIIDLMIAAEALYLGTGNSKDRGEQRYRMSLRSAAFADGKQGGGSRALVFAIMRDAYDLRSGIVHGSRFDPKAKGSASKVPSEDIIKSAATIVRLGLQKAIRIRGTTGGSFSYDWENLLLSAP